MGMVALSELLATEAAMIAGPQGKPLEAVDYAGARKLQLDSTKFFTGLPPDL
jgi:hypothetical protein